LKSDVFRLDRVQAREFLSEIESMLSHKKGKSATDAVVRFLNSRVPGYSWVGIYMVEGEDLVLAAWSGPEATQHTRIPIGKGVCGYAAKTGRTEIVSDVSKDPRYLQCFISTKAEIVVPVFKGGKVIGEIDVDGDRVDAFSSLDGEFLEAVAGKLGPVC